MAIRVTYLLEKPKRIFRTVFFVVAMVASLLASSLPLLVAMGDVLVPCILIPSFTCISCNGFREHIRIYDFKSSLTDIPLVSIIRSLIITCVYSMCDGPALSHGPYIGTVTVSSLSSIILLSIKACLFSMNSQIEAEASLSSISRQRLHLKKSWGMPVLFLSSVVFALGHTVVAYRTSCRARRKLMFHRIDPEAGVFFSYQKVPRSPTPTNVKTFKAGNEDRRKPLASAFDEREISVRVLADSDSCFILCEGITVHYKLSFPYSTPHSFSSTAFLETSVKCGTPPARLQVNKHPFSPLTHNLQRSYSIQLNNSSSLYAPLLDESISPTALCEEIPVLNLDHFDEECGGFGFNSLSFEQDPNEKQQFGIVLVHGFGGGVFSWRHVMGVLARQVGCTVAAFDRPGWGLSSRPRRKHWEEKQLPNPYKIENQVDLLLSFCSEMGFSSVVIVGHDDGGLLALKAAERVRTSSTPFNVTIKGVVLVNVSLTRVVIPAFARILLHTSLGKKHLVQPLLRTEITQVVNHRAWYDVTKLTPEVLSFYKAPLRVEGWDEALHEIGRLSYETVLSPQRATSLVKAVDDLPVLVIAGAEDVLIPIQSSQSMASRFVNSRLLSLSGCGHLPQEECPKSLVAAMSPFLSRFLPRTESEQ